MKTEHGFDMTGLKDAMDYMREYCSCMYDYDLCLFEEGGEIKYADGKCEDWELTILSDAAMHAVAEWPHLKDEILDDLFRKGLFGKIDGSI